MNVNETLSSVTSMLKGVVALGLALAVTFLIVDLLFPGTTNIVSNVAGLVKSFTSQGLIGLITLIVFVAIFNKE